MQLGEQPPRNSRHAGPDFLRDSLMHVLITRPEPDAAALRAQLEALGHTVTVEPLLRSSICRLPADAVDGVAGLVVTSRNGLRALAASPAFDAALELPLIAVGPGTAGLAPRTRLCHE